MDVGEREQAEPLVAGRDRAEGVDRARIRGQPVLDIDALANALSRVSLLITDHAGRIAEIDINPLFVRPQGQGVLAADALIVLKD